MKLEFPAVSRALLDRWTLTVGQQFLPIVRPVYVLKPSGIPDQVGSCVLVQMAGRRYVVTAAHIADQLASARLYIGGQKEFVEITGQCLTTPKPEGDRNKDHYDFAIWPIPTDAASQLGEVTYIDAKEIAPNRHSREGLFYVAYGYPNTRNTFLDVSRYHAPAWAFRHTARSLEDRALARRLGISGDDHLFVSYEKYVSNGLGTRARSVKPKGLSGGALIELDVWSSFHGRPRGRLAGIILSRPPQKRTKLVAVKIHLVLASIPG